MAKIGFAILLDDQSYNYARKIELEFCREFNLCWGLKQSPHITIKSPFDTDNIDPFVRYLEKKSSAIEPFELRLEGFGFFEPKVIFLDVKENKSLTDLHLGILNDLSNEFGIDPNEFEGRNFKFHSSLALEDVTEEKFVKAKKYLLDKNQPCFTFEAKTLGIFYYLGKEAGWIIVERISLKG